MNPCPYLSPKHGKQVAHQGKCTGLLPLCSALSQPKVPFSPLSSKKKREKEGEFKSTYI
jgi:hypothetical protein